MEINPIKTAEVQVIAQRTPDFHIRVQSFTKLLLGTTPNGLEAELLNPNVLEFSSSTLENGEKYTEVSAREPLIILNKRLGYKLTYLLEKAGMAGERAWYQGQLSFEELPPRDSMQVKVWKINRNEAYRGSLNHFFHTLFAQYGEKFPNYQGFKARRIANETTYLSNAVSGGLSLPLDSLSILPDKVGTGFSILFPSCFEVCHAIEPDYAYKKYFRGTAFDDGAHSMRWTYRSLIVPQKPVIRADKQGFMYSPDDFIIYGYWGWRRLADEVPSPFVME